MTTQLLDRGFRPLLLEQGFEVAMDALELGLGTGSLYRLARQDDVGGGDRVAYVTPRDDGFDILVEVASADIPREAIEKLRDPEDGYALVAFPPPFGVSSGGWSLGVTIGDYVWDGFPGWDAVLANPHVARPFIGFIVERAQVLREYVWNVVQRASSSGSDARERAFGPLQEVINNPMRIETGEVSPERTLELFRRAFTAVPDSETYESLRMWIGGQSMREMSEGRFDGPWASISVGVNEFGETRGWF
jgi:hypothetical protein